jgi:hypothetical protein
MPQEILATQSIGVNASSTQQTKGYPIYLTTSDRASYVEDYWINFQLSSAFCVESTGDG